MALSYESSGVNYDSLDAFKRACQREASTTTGALAQHGMSEPKGVRGESAYLIDAGDHFLAHVEEGLGTKNLVADAMEELTETSYYANIGIDTVATIVNDLVTTGALPISIAMHAGVGDSAWFEHQRRSADLARGFAEACRVSGAVWGGGETPALRGIIKPGTIVLAGSAIGRISPKSNRIVGDVRDGDVIIMLTSSGVQTNGLTLCREIGSRTSELGEASPRNPGASVANSMYLEPMSDGRTYGDALLDASVIYVPFIAALQRRNIRPHYAAHITGHGWRKLMRLEEPFVYRITSLRTPPPVFEFIAKHGPVDQREMYATFNMGAGFAVYVAPEDVSACLESAKQCGIAAWIAGDVRKMGDRKAVEIPDLGITFEAESLSLR